MDTWQLRIRRLMRMNAACVDRAALRSSGAAAEAHGCPSTPRDRSGAGEENERAACGTFPARLDDRKPPRPSRTLLAGLMLALFVAALDSTVVATAMPAIAAGLGVSSGYAWPLTSYLLTCTVTALLAGGLVAKFGHLSMYTAGLALFAAASLGCAASPSVEALSLWRGIEGVGGGILEAGVFIAAVDLFEPRERGAYLGAASAMYGLASIAGPLLGGIIVQALSWHWIFLVNVPIGAVALALVVRHLPAGLGRGPGSFDAAGAVAAAATVSPLTVAFSLSSTSFELGSIPFVALVVCSIAAGAILVAVERRRENAVVPVRILVKRIVSAGLVSGFSVQFALMAVVTFLPGFVQGSFGMGDAQAGMALVPMTLALMVGSNSAGALFRSHGKLRTNSLLGFALIATGGIGIALASGGRSLIALEAFVALLGLGVGFGMPTANLAAQIGSAPADMGKATSLAMFFRGFGGTVSSAIVGTLCAVPGTGAREAMGAAITVAVVGMAASAFLPLKVERGR